ARLQSIAEAGGIVMSYETYALVRHIVAAHPLPAITVKGITREIIPYAVDGLVGESDDGAQVFSAHGDGLDLFVDVNAVDAADAARLRGVLSAAIEALDKRGSSG
ncbi:MAG: adenylate/guanylate cyclase domain-containing protein, partial [Candidatus Eremiobacteraeota bacterium]|nr:adenylate/guanylate cyclase domain-containing protein [Candidatus Eremiobacteraeota bacterium]